MHGILNSGFEIHNMSTYMTIYDVILLKYLIFIMQIIFHYSTIDNLAAKIV